MGREKDRLPIVIGKGMKKGILGMRTRKGYDVWICSLKRKHETGTKFPITDIEKIDTVLRFADKESVETTIGVLKQILKGWKEVKE